jgi:hypothetical protein
MLVSDYLNYREKHFSVIKTQPTNYFQNNNNSQFIIYRRVPSTVPTNEYRTICCCRNHYFISNQLSRKNRNRA